MRALRRHHRQRLEKRRKAYYGGVNPQFPENHKIAIDTPARCSAPGCCGNRRRAKKGRSSLTLQELRAALVESESEMKEEAFSNYDLDGPYHWITDTVCKCNPIEEQEAAKRGEL